jgi:hypothetical protein
VTEIDHAIKDLHFKLGLLMKKLGEVMKLKKKLADQKVHNQANRQAIRITIDELRDLQQGLE